MNLINEEKENITRLNVLKEREEKVYETISVGSITRFRYSRENSVFR